MNTDGKQLIETGNLVLKQLAQYLDDNLAGKGKVLELRSMQNLFEELDLAQLMRNGGMDMSGLQCFLDRYLQASVRMHHPTYIGHQVAAPHLGSAMGDLVHGIISNPMSIYEMGQSAATVEHEVVQWMLEKVGWASKGAGVFTHGGSLANIHAMLTARAAIAPGSWVEGCPPDLVVLAPENSHYSIARAVSIVGLGSHSIVPIPTDKNERVIPDQLYQIMKDVRESGNRIMAVVANACATSTGIYDPIKELGICCNEQGCWLHLDSPHGATAILSEKYKSLLDGVELADSMNWDAHKMMQTSSLSTAILFKDRHRMEVTLAQKASYLIHPKEDHGFDSLPYQLECTKSGLATKFFLVLACLGEKGMETFITTLYDRARAYAQVIDQRPGFHVEIPVESNIICFQYQPDQIDQLELREKLVSDGNFYITSTEVQNQRFLRLVIMNENTTAQTIEALLDRIEDIA